MSSVECPKYRVRIFLSVDLSNSTSFKSTRPPHQWVSIFRNFYAEFTELYKRKHLQLVEENGSDVAALRKRPPRLWKTVGDEIVFVNRVDSCFEVYLFVKAFSLALGEYGDTLRNDSERKSLGVKGAGWIASFPYPNVSIEIPSAIAKEESDLSESEALEKSADENPNNHEFLGKGLDYGFRIGQHSSEDFFSISPALADVLARARVNEDYSGLSVQLVVKPPVKLKGVLDGRDYPVIGIPIDRNEEWGSYRRLQEKLIGGNQSNDGDLRKYFQHFIQLHEIEQPCLKTRPSDLDPNPPTFYTEKYVPFWSASAKEVEDQEQLIQEGASQGDEGDPPAEQVIDAILKRVSSKKPS